MKVTDIERDKSSKGNPAATNFFYRHPYIAYWTVFLGMPVAVLLGVMVSASAIILPFSFLLGLI